MIADDVFKIPSPLGVSQLLTSARLEGQASIDKQAYAHVLKSVFLEIALPFLPGQASEEDLMVKAKQLVTRLRSGALAPLNNRLLMIDRSPCASPSAANGVVHDPKMMLSLQESAVVKVIVLLQHILFGFRPFGYRAVLWLDARCT